jgi:hypothetical protein
MCNKWALDKPARKPTSIAWPLPADIDLIFNALLMNMAAQGSLLVTYDDGAGAETSRRSQSGAALNNIRFIAHSHEILMG